MVVNPYADRTCVSNLELQQNKGRGYAGIKLVKGTKAASSCFSFFVVVVFLFVFFCFFFVVFFSVHRSFIT